jgi:hypothetical protein
VTATLETRCAYSGRALTLVISVDGDVDVREEGASPLLFEPEIDWTTFTKAHILDDF